MRYVFVVLALLGIIVSSLALREHYRVGDSPCDINDKWDCGVVNQSVFAVIAGVPVAAIGIGGYFLLGILALKRWYRLMGLATLVALTFSLYLTHIERDVLRVWCIYCVSSLGIISLFTLLSIGTLLAGRARTET
jgi:uncharacterized membrane protein